MPKEPGLYKSEKPTKLTRIDEAHLKNDCINGSIVIGVRKPTLCSFALQNPPGQKIPLKPRNILFNKINKICFVAYYIFFRK